MEAALESHEYIEKAFEKKSQRKLSSKGAAKALDNMDLQTNLEPKDGVSLFENTAKAPVRPSSNHSQGKGVAASQKSKFQLTKKGRPYQKFGKDNSTLRMTREKYF